MKNYRLSEELGNIDEMFLEEVYEYKKEKRITMTKRKLAIIIAAVIVLVLSLPAYATVKYWRPIIGHYASLEDGTAVVATPGSIKVSAKKISDDVVKFVIDADKSVYPFNEYGDLTITSYWLYKKYQTTNEYEHVPYLGRSYKPETDFYGIFECPLAGDSDLGELTYEQYVDDYDMYFVKKPNNGKLSKKQKYILEVEVIYGRNADGELKEIRGNWRVEFKL